MWEPWRRNAGCLAALPRDKLQVATHAAMASEFAKNLVRGFDNLRAAAPARPSARAPTPRRRHFIAQSEHLFRSNRLPDFVGRLEDAAAAWRIFAAGAGRRPPCFVSRPETDEKETSKVIKEKIKEKIKKTNNK